MWQENISLFFLLYHSIFCDITGHFLVFKIRIISGDISTDVLLLFIQVLGQDCTTILLTRTMMAEIKKWTLMICAILKTKILPPVPPSSTANVGPYARFLDFSQTCPTGLICLKTLSIRHFQNPPLPLEGPPPPACSIYEAIEASNLIYNVTQYMISYPISHLIYVTLLSYPISGLMSFMIFGTGPIGSTLG